MRFCLLYALNQLSSASFYNTLAFKFLPRLSASLQCFVLKGHFEPRCGLFCLFGRFKRTFRAWMQRVLSFWQVQKDISSLDTACFVLLTASKRHFEPRCGLFCLFARFKRTFRARMQRVLSFWLVQKDIWSLDTACFVLLTASKRHFGSSRNSLEELYVKKARKIDGLPSHRTRFKCKLFPAFFIKHLQ
ncbi:UNVERIFIED_ORG: ABC-type transporter Mla MlaB component [Heyndrickxia coagulans]